MKPTNNDSMANEAKEFINSIRESEIFPTELEETVRNTVGSLNFSNEAICRVAKAFEHSPLMKSLEQEGLLGFMGIIRRNHKLFPSPFKEVNWRTVKDPIKVARELVAELTVVILNAHILDLPADQQEENRENLRALTGFVRYKTRWLVANKVAELLEAEYHRLSPSAGDGKIT